MPRFELGTSSLPRRHTAGLCHIGTVLLVFIRSLTGKHAGHTLDRLLNNVVSNPYKTLRKVWIDTGKKQEKSRRRGKGAGFTYKGFLGLVPIKMERTG